VAAERVHHLARENQQQQRALSTSHDGRCSVANFTLGLGPRRCLGWPNRRIPRLLLQRWKVDAMVSMSSNFTCHRVALGLPDQHQNGRCGASFYCPHLPPYLSVHATACTADNTPALPAIPPPRFIPREPATLPPSHLTSPPHPARPHASSRKGGQNSSRDATTSRAANPRRRENQVRQKEPFRQISLGLARLARSVARSLHGAPHTYEHTDCNLTVEI
jgi:hypothetical protein